MIDLRKNNSKMGNKEINCNEAALLIESKLDEELDESSKAILDAHVSTCKHCRDELVKMEKTVSLLKEGALIPPKTLYSSVMNKISSEKKSRSVFVRRLGTACAAAFVFIMACAMLLPRFVDGVNSNNDITAHGVKSKIVDGITDKENEAGAVVLSSFLSDAKIEINGTEYQLAKIQVGTIALVLKADEYFAYDLRDGTRVELSDLVTDEEGSVFEFTKEGIALESGRVILWDSVPDSVKEEYAMTSTPLVLDRARASGYEFIIVE